VCCVGASCQGCQGDYNLLITRASKAAAGKKKRKKKKKSQGGGQKQGGGAEDRASPNRKTAKKQGKEERPVFIEHASAHRPQTTSSELRTVSTGQTVHLRLHFSVLLIK
jgi:hypothetical protein